MGGGNRIRVTRQVIADAGYGDWFPTEPATASASTSNEDPIIPPEDDTSLEAGMTFTVEPSVFWPAGVGVRAEAIMTITPNQAHPP